MQALMQTPARKAPRVLSPEEAFVAEMSRRHGENLLLIEARKDDQTPLVLLVVLDLDATALAAERQMADGGLSVEFIDKASWLAMRRLSASGLLMFSQGAQTLYRSAALPVEKTVTAGDENLGPLAIVRATRILQMAKVLAAGGFGEEARPLLAKSLQSAAVALNAVRRLGALGAVGDADIRRLVEQAILPPEALSVFEAVNSACASEDIGDIEPHIAATARILAIVKRNELALLVDRRWFSARLLWTRRQLLHLRMPGRSGPKPVDRSDTAPNKARPFPAPDGSARRLFRRDQSSPLAARREWKDRRVGGYRRLHPCRVLACA